MTELSQLRVTPSQLRAARALLNLSIVEMAAVGGCSKDTLSAMERGINNPHQDTWDGLLQAFDQRGIVFTPDNGVRERNDLFTLIEGKTPYLDLMEDVYTTMRGTHGEVLFFYIDNSRSPQAVIDADLRLRRDGVRFRSIIDETNPFCLYPLKEYRCVPHELYQNNPILVYANKVAVMIDASPSPDKKREAVHLTRNVDYSSAMRRLFETVWATHKMPKNTIAEVTYD